MRRRTWLLAGASLLTTSVIAGVILLDGEEAGISVTLGPPRWIMPVLRYSLSGQERLAVMVRRSEAEILPSGTTRPPVRGDRLEIRSFDAATLAPLFQEPIISVATNGAPSAGLLAEHAATMWIIADTIGAISAVDGQVLIEREGLIDLTPDLESALIQPRLNFSIGADGIVLQTSSGPRRLNPRTLRAESLPAPSQPLPELRRSAPFELSLPGAFSTAEARIGETWFGFAFASNPPVDGTFRPNISGFRFLPGSGQPGRTPQRLWRARLGTGTSTAAPPAPTNTDTGFQGSAARTAATRPAPGALTYVRFDSLTALPFDPADLGHAGFLTLGARPDSEPLRPPGAPGLLILHRAADTNLGLTRINAQGSPAWTTALPINRLVSCIPGEGPLLLAGITTAGAETLIAVNLDTGATVSRTLAETGTG